MKKFLFKPLIYLLAVTMVLPSWAVMGMMGIQKAEAAGPSPVSVVEWNFPNNPDNTLADDIIVTGQDLTVPTGTITYSSTVPTQDNVTATLTPSEHVTVTSAGGFTHTFTDNSSFLFTFVDDQGTTGSELATVSNIDRVAPTATLTGQPVNYSNANVNITVGGLGVAAYKYSLDSATYSDAIDVSIPIVLTALTDGAHTLSVIGGDLADNWQDVASATTDSWIVDTVAPASTGITINHGATYTKLQTVNLNLAATDNFVPMQMMIGNDSDFTNSTWVPFSATSTWSLLAGDGTKTVFAKFMDGGGATSVPVSAQIILDQTRPVIQLNTVNNSADLVFHYGDTFVDPGYVASDATSGLSGNVMVSFAPDTGIITQTPWIMTYIVSDKAGNTTIVIRQVSVVLAPNQVILAAGTTQLQDPTKNEVIIESDFGDNTATLGFDSTITNPTLNVSGITKIDSTGKSAVLPGMTINVQTASGMFSLEITAGTKVTGPLDWNGKINLPALVANPNINSLLAAGTIGTNLIEVEIGFGDKPLSFDQAVKIILPGQAGKTVGYVRNNQLYPIADVCAFDTVTGKVQLIPGKECKTTTVGSTDLTIWTTHFTKFVAYNTEIVAAPMYIVSATDKLITVAWQGTGADSYTVTLNNTLVDTIAGGNDTGKTYTKQYGVLDYGTFTVLVRAIKAGVTSLNTIGIQVTLTAPATVVQSVPATPVTTTSIVPPKAEAAAPTPTPSQIQTPSDDNGVVKGDDTTAPATDEKTNWTPWIVLFILIILAGGATGGYFYLSGREESAVTVSSRQKSPATSVKNPAKIVKKDLKKTKRW